MKQPELGQKIVELRSKKGLTQEELVEICNLNVRTLQRIESGKVSPRFYTIKVIFEALNYNINDEVINESFNKETFLENKINEINKQLKKNELMKKTKSFFHNYFLASGIVWFFCALSILIFKLNFQAKEILLIMIIPFAFSVFKYFTKNELAKPIENEKE